MICLWPGICPPCRPRTTDEDDEGGESEAALEPSDDEVYEEYEEGEPAAKRFRYEHDGADHYSDDS